MKKLLAFLAVGILILVGTGAVALHSGIEKSINDTLEKNNSGRDYTHTVLIEVATYQDCYNCDDWSAIIYDTYNSEDYDFEYVEMIVIDHDEEILNDKAYEWKESYNIPGFPTSIFDGDYDRIVGNLPDQLQDALNACGARTVKDIDGNISLSWLGDARIQVDIEIINNEITDYNGYIRVPISEITSRYTTANGLRYHYGFLDYVFNEDISIIAGGTYTNSVVWDGNDHQDNQGNNFGDITPNNMKIIMGVFNDDNEYIDETVVALFPENQPPSIPTITGPLKGKVGNSYQYNYSSTDLEGDNVSYYIEWMDGDITPWTDYQLSGTLYSESHIWTKRGTYTIRAKAKDEYLEESDWAELEVTIPRVKVINKPLLRFINNPPNMLQFLGMLLQLLGQ